MISVNKINSETTLTFADLKLGNYFCPSIYSFREEKNVYEPIFMKLSFQPTINGSPMNSVWLTGCPGTLCVFEDTRSVKLVNADFEIIG